MFLIPFISGIFIVFTMTLNSFIGRKTSLLEGVFLNYLFGLFTIITISIFYNYTFTTSPMYSYLGGLLGVTVIFISNYFIPNIPVIYTVFLGFLGQIFSGILIDYFFNKNEFEIKKIIGAILVIIALLYLFIIEKKEKAKISSR